VIFEEKTEIGKWVYGGLGEPQQPEANRVLGLKLLEANRAMGVEPPPMLQQFYRFFRKVTPL